MAAIAAVTPPPPPPNVRPHARPPSYPAVAQRPITVNGGMRMTGWYDIASLDRLDSEAQDAEAMQESKRCVDADPATSHVSAG